MKKKKKTCQNKKRLIQFGAGALVVLVAVVFLALSFKNNPEITGSLVKVQYYGIDDQPLEAFAGKIQTSITLEQPTLKEMSRIEGGEEASLKVAEEIAERVDFAPDIARLYQENPIFPIRGDDLSAVESAAGKEASDFGQKTVCLKKIGSNYGRFETLEMVLISELRFQKCEQNPSWHFAWMEHTFYQPSEGFTCSQDGERLFYVNDGGLIMTELEEC